MADQNSLLEYLAARRAGKRYFAEHDGKRGGTGYLDVLEDKLREIETVGEIRLGTYEIPLENIVGTYTAARSTAFAGNFMPLLGEGTEFASKWQSLYSHHIKVGISDPIKVYEFLNKFYVLEGNKRVSVLNYVGAYSVRADVIRIVPKRDPKDREISIYYEFLDYNSQILAFVGMWFSKRGSFTKLMSEARSFSEKVPQLKGKKPHEWLPQVFRDFSRQYKAAGFGSLDITTGDAFVEYVKIYGFPYGEPYELLGHRVRNCEAQFRLVAGKGGQKVIDLGDVRRTGGLKLIPKISQRRARAVFVYRSPYDKSPRTRAHEYGRLQAEKRLEGRFVTEAVYGIGEKDAHNCLVEIAKTKPDIIFTVNSRYGHASLQTSLESSGVIVFNCNHTQPGKRLNTYYCKLYELTFMLGILAGSYTKSNIIGFIMQPPSIVRSTYGINAFALGARLVNHNVRVLRASMRSEYSAQEDRMLRAELASKGVDVVYSQYPNEDPAWLNRFDNLYGMLCAVTPNGSVADYLATSAWNWDVVYTKILGDYLDGNYDFLLKTPESTLNFWLGLSTGATDVYMADIVLGPHTVRLGKIFRELLEQSHIHPFSGPVKDNQGIVRIAKNDIPTLLDIQNMRWLCDIIYDE
ncbi:MAG: BMP family ABC transporter substrate-binding protein [Eubacteriales bacterium]|jgi:basic membrane protein A